MENEASLDRENRAAVYFRRAGRKEIWSAVNSAKNS